MSIWSRFAELFSDAASGAFASVIEAVRTLFEGDPQTRRRVAFSIAMIALSAKMAKADGVVTQPEIAAFHRIFEIPAEDRAQVVRLYTLAQQDVAGFEAYASQLARLCEAGTHDCPVLEDILDGLFHIAKSDGVVHERELHFLAQVAGVFGISDGHFDTILARHIETGRRDPFAVLGVAPDTPMPDIRKAWLQLVRDNHPDTAVARGMPEEFVAVANARLAAINAAWDAIEGGKRAA
ncbi:MAG: DnaJ family molecular chaperone [Rhizobiaceae bacterium]|jgi:DnaJ like chaperone protein|nr:DnaJ family molecular chaperone [Rhizobiaceae bacterium]